jgi:hypothetical protein
MQFTCDRCHGDYDAKAHNAAAHLFLKDSRCNHIEALCSHCGNKEVIFLGPRQITSIIRDDGLTPSVEAEATPQLRVRAEKAWAAADEKEGVPETDGVGTGGSSPMHGGPAGAADVLQRYELTRRHEDLLDAFGDTLSNIPDDLLWDELRGDHDRKHPDRWID